MIIYIYINICNYLYIIIDIVYCAVTRFYYVPPDDYWLNQIKPPPQLDSQFISSNIWVNYNNSLT